MAIALRDYQAQVVRETYSCLREEGIRRVCVFGPTGSGKTVVGATFMRDAVAKGRRSLFLVHRKPLYKQTYRTLVKGFEIPENIIGSHPSSLIQILSAQSLGKREVPPHDILLIDECHTTSFFNEVRKLIDLATERNSFVLGLTATPYRLQKNQSLGDYYQKLVKAPDIKELIKIGALVPLRYFSFEGIDVSQIPINRRTNDFDEAQLEAVSNTPKMLNRMIQEYSRLAWGRRTIVFAAGIKHSLAIARKFNENGVPCEHVDGTMSEKRREAIYKKLEDGEIWAITSVEALCEGFDCPPASCCIHFRATASKAKKEQMEGRVTRIVTLETCEEFLKRFPTFRKDDAIIIDLVGNTSPSRHGRLDDPHNIQLHSSGDASEGDAPVKVCPKCNAVIHAWRRFCPECEHEFELLPIELPDGELQEQLQDWEIEQVEYLHYHARIAYERNYKPGYATMKFKEQYGYFPAVWWRRGAVFGIGAGNLQKSSYRKYLVNIAEKNNYDAAWVAHWLEREFGLSYLTATFD